ncbi:MAG: hypothetical protein DRN05_04230 [Thermoplasmata archaeon]|nr:MAG: hypothetical protein DRN05_04230 [Thermoplasmata archaeon]
MINDYRNGIVLGITILLIGTIISPNITADINTSYPIQNKIYSSSDSDDAIEIICNIYSMNGIKEHRIQISKEKALEIKEIISRIELELYNAKDLKETIAIFKKAIMSFDNYGLLPENTKVEELQEIATNGYHTTTINDILENKYKTVTDNVNVIQDNSTIQNTLCLVSGSTDTTTFIPVGFIPMSLFVGIIYILEKTLPDKFPTRALKRLLYSSSYIALSLLQLYSTICYVNPIKIFNKILIGDHLNNISAYGWIHTIGLKGIKKIKGHLYGDVHGTDIGITGFMGMSIKIHLDVDYDDFFYMGSALHVSVVSV